ncbi:MAG: DUF2809 domain-containing protein [Agathobacter sp.]|nr:DUF2809 domain-containing protein [Agathobacter sp.]
MIEQKKQNINKRILYAITTIILLVIEVLIALFVHDSIIRPYIGDVLVVVVIYTFVRIFVPERVVLLPLYIFVFAVGVELLQLVNVLDLLGLRNNEFFRVLLGSVFDTKDVICYAVGCLILGGYQVIKKKICSI